jgi:hypothetical protein
MPRSVPSAAAILLILALPRAYGGLKALTWTQRGLTPASQWQGVVPGVCWCLGLCPHGLRGPLAQTGAHPTGQPSRHRHHGALLAPGRRYPVDNFLEHLVTGKRAPGGCKAQGTHAPCALAAHRATPHRRSRRIRAGREPRGAAQRPRIGQACHSAQRSRQGPGDHRADARDAPRHCFACRWRGGLCTPQAASLDELARRKTPLLGQPRETHAEGRGQRPGSALPPVPVADHAPTRRGDQAELRQLGFALAGTRGAGLNKLRACSRQEASQFLFCRGDIEAS